MTVFQDLIKKNTSNTEKQSVDWFRQQAQLLTTSPKQLIDTAEPFKRVQSLSESSIGKMYLFKYDPKYKATLPYYDTYPLIFPVEYYNDSMLAMNLHYLPPVLRAKLMDSLYSTINNTKYNKTTKLRISYSILQSAAQFKYFTPCLKKYLFSNIRSMFLYVSPDEWDIALMMPLQRFAKANESVVYKDSVSKV